MQEDKNNETLKIVLKGGKEGKKEWWWGESDQSTLYACMEIPQ
jgi:hypothetical protein